MKSTLSPGGVTVGSSTRQSPGSSQCFTGQCGQRVQEGSDTTNTAASPAPALLSACAPTPASISSHTDPQLRWEQGEGLGRSGVSCLSPCSRSPECDKAVGWPHMPPAESAKAVAGAGGSRRPAPAGAVCVCSGCCVSIPVLVALGQPPSWVIIDRAGKAAGTDRTDL